MIVRPLVLLVLCVGVVTACDAPRSDPHHKPTAAVDVRLDATSVGGGDYVVTLTATPTRSTDALELVLDGRKLDAGATPAGEPRALTVRVHTTRGREVFGAAAVGQGNLRRNRAAAITLGTPAAQLAPPVTIVTLPDGSEVAEVRE